MHVLNDNLTDAANVDIYIALLYKHTETDADTIQVALKKVIS